MKKNLLSFILFISFLSAFGCSCSSFKAINAYSMLEFIGLAEFTSLTEIENSDGVYQSTFKLKELFKGNANEQIYVDSKKGSSCAFLPQKKRTYLLLAYKTKNGRTIISYCQAYGNPDQKTLSLLRQLKAKKIEEHISSNLMQITKNDINSKLFQTSVKGIFLYKVRLDSNLKIQEIVPQNKNALQNFDEKIKQEFLSKIRYEIREEDKTTTAKNFTSYIILRWGVNYKGERIISPARL